MKKRLLFLVTLALSFMLVLAACGSDNDNSANDPSNENNNDNNSTETNEGNDEEASGGTLTYAIDNAPEGLYIPGFTSSAIDSEIHNFMHENLVTTNENLEYIPNIADWETDDNKEYTFTIKEGVKWHNGEELTMEDWQFALEVIADPDYDGPRFNYVQEIEGAKAVKDGEADEISGFEIVDPYTAVITFEEAKVNNLENLWTHPMPKKHLEGIEVAELEESVEVREEPVGLGPFKVKEIQPGEYVSLERFDDYWQGTPKLDEVLVRVIDPTQTLGSLQNGEIDIMEIRPDDIPQLEELDHIDIVEQQGLGYSYIGFRFGHYDYDNRTAVADFDKFNNKDLRKAMFYALDRQSIIDAYLGGKATVVNTPVPSVHWIAADESELTQYDYDPEKAEKLLDEAGYTIPEGEEWRTDPDGNEFTIKFGHFAGTAAFEGRAEAIMQNWRDVGLNTELASGQLIEFNTYNEMKENDDLELEVFFGAWSTGTDPDPSGLWHSTAEYNHGRWVNEESDELLEEGLSEASFDQDHRTQVYIDWQKLYNEELPGLPLWENVDLYGINNHLKGYEIDAVGLRDFHEWYIEEE